MQILKRKTRALGCPNAIWIVKNETMLMSRFQSLLQHPHMHDNEWCYDKTLQIKQHNSLQAVEIHSIVISEIYSMKWPPIQK